VLQSSPFYRSAEELVLVQKNIVQSIIGMTAEQSLYMRGGHYALKQYSYYFSNVNDNCSIDPTYYAHNNSYRSVVLHELTHQLISRYYGKISNSFIEMWKNEGYAEYMAAIGYYSTQADLLAILIENPISDQMLETPFMRIMEEGDKNVHDYMAAFLQTRYALDVKHISPIDFFKTSYKPASAQAIKEWLMKNDDFESI